MKNRPDLQTKTPEALASGVLVTKLESPAEQFSDAPDRRLARSLIFIDQAALSRARPFSLNRWRLIVSTCSALQPPQAATQVFSRNAIFGKGVCSSDRILV
jgi:hypothetical protein